MGLAAEEVDQAYIEYANLLNWLRTLIDRMRSQDPNSKAIFDRDPVIAGEPMLTNFGLHLHVLPGGGSPTATVDVDGRVRLLIPDKPGDRIYLFDQFTYDDQRELTQFAHEVLDRVEAFVGQLPTAFEVGPPTRWHSVRSPRPEGVSNPASRHERAPLPLRANASAP